MVDYDNISQEVEQKIKSVRKINWRIIIFSSMAVLLLIMGVLTLFLLGSNPNSNIQPNPKSNLFDCGTLNAKESATVFNANEVYDVPESIKEKFNCMYNNIEDCFVSNLTFSDGKNTSVLSIVESAEDFCKIRYYSNSKLYKYNQIECRFTKESLSLKNYNIGGAPLKENETWAIPAGITLFFGMEMVFWDQGTDHDIKDSNTGKVIATCTVEKNPNWKTLSSGGSGGSSSGGGSSGGSSGGGPGGSSSGNSGGDDTTCIDECTTSGCSGSAPYTCSMKSDGCYDKVLGNTCSSNQICNSTTASCVTGSCVSNCTNKECGNDGCALSGCGSYQASCIKFFGTCNNTGTKTCNSSFLYTSCSALDPRIANCIGKERGDDGCGGDCINYSQSSKHVCNFNLNQSNSVNYLTNNQQCVVISANNVTLNCNGHMISNNGTITGVSVEGNNSKIYNCNIYNAYDGIYIGKKIENISIGNVTSNNNNNSGIELGLNSQKNNLFNINCSGNYYGIYLESKYDNFVNINLYNNTYGIYEDIGIFNTFKNINSSFNANDGFWMDSHGSLENIYSEWNHGSGIRFSGGWNNVTNSTAKNNLGMGIQIVNGYSNIIKNTDVTNNSYGISFSDEDNIIANNFVSDNSEDGIYLKVYTSNNLIANNTILNSRGNGIHSAGNHLWHNINNTIIQNNISNNKLSGIFFEFSDNGYITINKIYNNSMSQDYGGIHFYNSFNNTIFQNNISNNLGRAIGFMTDLGENFVSNTMCNNNLNFNCSITPTSFINNTCDGTCGTTNCTYSCPTQIQTTGILNWFGNLVGNVVKNITGFFVRN